jgi:hypothetical protein
MFHDLLFFMRSLLSYPPTRAFLWSNFLNIFQKEYMKKLMYVAILALCSATAYGMQPINDQPQPSTQDVQQEADKNAQARKNKDQQEKYQQEVDTLIAQLNLNPHDYAQAQSWFARHKKQLLIGATVTAASVIAFLIWYLVKKRAAAEMLAQTRGDAQNELTRKLQEIEEKLAIAQSQVQAFGDHALSNQINTQEMKDADRNRLQEFLKRIDYLTTERSSALQALERVQKEYAKLAGQVADHNAELQELQDRYRTQKQQAAEVLQKCTEERDEALRQFAALKDCLKQHQASSTANSNQDEEDDEIMIFSDSDSDFKASTRAANSAQRGKEAITGEESQLRRRCPAAPVRPPVAVAKPADKQPTSTNGTDASLLAQYSWLS